MQMKNGALAVVLALAGCSGNPWYVPPVGSVATLPGTTAPSASKSLVRTEPTTEQSSTAAPGDGYAQNITDNGDGTYSVDNLGFDGDNRYTTAAPQPITTPYQIYESADAVQDSQTGAAITQFTHRLIAGKSASGQSEFAIVRTGSYTDYGFGGFVIKRNGGVVLPTDGQAAYSGKYAGLRDFTGVSGLEYTTADMEMAIDFKDFNKGDAVKGSVFNRKVYDMNGTDITGQVVAAMNAKYNKDGNGPDRIDLPTMVFAVGPGVIDSNGELNGNLGSTVVNYNGTTPKIEGFEQGKYYAMVSGDTANEVVGIIVVTAPNPALDGSTVRETGGFILYRP